MKLVSFEILRDKVKAKNGKRKKAYTQKELASACSVSPRTIQKLFHLERDKSGLNMVSYNKILSWVNK